VNFKSFNQFDRSAIGRNKRSALRRMDHDRQHRRNALCLLRPSGRHSWQLADYGRKTELIRNPAASVLDMDDPFHTEAIHHRAIGRGKEGPRQGDLHLAALGQEVDQPFCFSLVCRDERQGEAGEGRLA
jgi:hypothetical protein